MSRKIHKNATQYFFVTFALTTSSLITQKMQSPKIALEKNSPRQNFSFLCEIHIQQMQYR